MTIRFNQKSMIGYLTMYCLLLFSSGFHFMNSNGTVALLIMLISSAVLIYINDRQFVVVSRLPMSIVLIFSICLASSVIAGDSIKVILIFAIGFIVAFTISSRMPIKDYMGVYVIVMRTLMVGSLVFCFYGWLTHQNYWVLPFPNIGEKEPALYAFFATLHDYGSQTRNASIFWEPGAYQTFLIFEFVFETTLHLEKHNKYRYIAVISLISTMSTVGIFAALLCFVYMLFIDKEHKKMSNMIRAGIFIVAVVIVGALLWYMFPEYISYLINRNIISKVNDFVYYNVNNQSSMVRVDSIIYPIRMFFSSPILGVGNSGYDWMIDLTGHTMSVCTPLNWFAKYGIFYGTFMIVGLYRTSKALFVNRLDRLFMIGLTLFSIASENYDNNPIIIAISLYGYTYQYSYKDDIETVGTVS